MATEPTAATKPPRRFQFIDNSTSASTKHNSTRVRRHVMQEHMRDKRWKARSKAEAKVDEQELVAPAYRPKRESVAGVSKRSRSQEGQPNFSIYPGPTASEIQEFTHADSRSTQGKPRMQNRSDGSLEQLPAFTWHSVEGFDSLFIDAESFAALAELFPYEPPSPTHTIKSGSSWSTSESLGDNIGSPLSLLSAARTDPFDALPISLSTKDQELFDFYATVMPSCSYGFERRNPKAHNWYRDVFIPEAMKGMVTFQNTVLVHAANTQAWVKGLTETPLALEHRKRASSVLLKHYQLYPEDISDAVITATMSAAALEDFDPRPERRPVAWMHWAAAMHKIRQRGGPVYLESTPSLRKLINWQDYIFSGYDGRGSTFFFTPEAIFVSNNEREKERYGKREIELQCDEFLTFLKCTDHLAAVAAAQLNNPVAHQYQPLRYSIFMPGHPLYVLLASPNKDRYTQTGQLKQIISRLAALMMINVAIWEYRQNPSHSEAFFQELVENIMNNELHKNISVEALLQILLSGNQNPDLQHFERPWLVGRLLKIAKRLSRSSWERLNDFLLSCLTLERDAGQGMYMHEWEDALQDEIMQAPLVSHQLPLMCS